MAIEIREFVGAETFFVNQSESKTKVSNVTEWYAEEMIDPDSIMVDIEGIHSIITRNYTYYEPNCLKESVPYWTNPYGIPVIMHHKERDGVTIGRIKAVEYTDKQTRSGTPALIFTINVPDNEGKKAILNGTLSTVSIGAIAHDVRCSVCGTNLAEHGLCEHEKGEMYDDKLCYWIIKKIEPKELSYVIVPSDKYAHNLRVYKPQQAANKKVVSESFNQSEVKKRMFDNPFADIEIIESTEEKEEQASEQEATTLKEEKVLTSAENIETDEEVKKESTESKEDEKTNKDEEKKEEVETDNKEECEDNKEKLLSELKKEIEALKAEIENLHKKLENEKQLKESAEKELLDFKLEQKKSLIEEIHELRKSLNLSEADNTELMKNSNDFLQLTINNLKEFSSINKNTLNIPKIQSEVAVSEKLDNTTKENKVDTVKENNNDSNIDLMEEAIKILTEAWK